MADFSSFFPSAGGGGGLLNTKKYSSSRSNAVDFPNQQPADVTFNLVNESGAQGNVTSMNTRLYTGPIAANQLVGKTVQWDGSTNATITSHPAGNLYDFIVFTYASGIGSANPGASVQITNLGGITVNPATDLGLADGAKLGYFMIGSGFSNGGTSRGSKGGNATGNTVSAQSTITGGLTISTSDGANIGWPSRSMGGSVYSTAYTGINGYGAGSSNWNEANDFGTRGAYYHGYGGGSQNTGVGGDGSITLYY